MKLVVKLNVLIMFCLLISCNKQTKQEKLEKNKIDSTPRDLNLKANIPINTDTLVGNGVLAIKEERNDRLYIVNMDSTFYGMIDFEREYLILERDTFNLFETNLKQIQRTKNFAPRILFPEYGIIHFNCFKNGPNVEIFIDAKNEVKKIVKLTDSSFRFYSWEEYLLNAYILVNSINNPIRTTPSIDSDTIKLNDYFFFKAIDVKGDWVRIKCSDDCKECDADIDGWVLWKQDSRILVQLGLFC